MIGGSHGPTQFSVLGPLLVTRADGSVLRLGEAKRRLLLALLLHHNQAVRSERLITLLWGEDPPDGSSQTLQSHVSQLRKQLGSDRIETTSGGYQLVVAPHELDALQFEADLARARGSLPTDPQAAATHAEAALGRWRGAALADADGLEWADGERARLEELRRQVEEIEMEALLAAGRHEEVVPRAEAAVIAEPIREQRWASLMVALYRCGRQADALRSFQRLRSALLDELGIDPSPELQQLEQAILGQDPSLLVGSEPATSLPSEVNTVDRDGAPADATLPISVRRRRGEPFVGRRQEQGTIAGALKTSFAGQPQIVLVSGQAGMGKSTLAARAALAAHADGASVVQGSCVEGVALPYEAFAGVVEQVLPSLAAPDLDAWREQFGGAVARGLPGIAIGGPASDHPVAADPDLDRHLLYRGIRELIAAAARTGPLLVLLEDVHWIDHSSATLLRFVVDALAEPVAFVLTARDRDGTESAASKDLLAHLHRSEAVTRVALDGLDDVDVIDLVERLAGQRLEGAQAGWVHSLRRETEGNPFFFRELLLHAMETGAARVDESGRWTLNQDPSSADLPAGVVDVLASRVAALGDGPAQVLAVAAVIGRTFDFELVAAVTGEPEDELLDALDQATRAGLLRADGSALAFTHSLVQRSLYDGCSPMRRARIHRDVAQALEARAGEVPVRELAHHWSAAIVPADTDKAVDYAIRAGELCLVELAPQDALAWFARAQELVGPTDSHDLARALVGLGSAQQRLGAPEHRSTLAKAAHMAERLGDDALLVEAALADDRGGPSSRGHVDQVRVDILDAALSRAAPGSRTKARLLAAKAIELVSEADPAPRLVLSDEALEVARASGDPSTLLHVHHLCFDARWNPESLPDRVSTVEEMERLSAHSDDMGRFRAAFRKVAVSMETADGAGLEGALGEMERIAARTEQPFMEWLSTMTRFCERLMVGRVEEAEALAERSLAIGTASGEAEALPVYGALLAEVRWHQGRLGELLPLLEESAATLPIPGLHMMVAMGLAEAGQVADSRAIVESYVDAGWQNVPFDEVWLATLGLATEVMVAVEMSSAAESVYQRILPYRDQFMFTRTTTFGSVERTLGQLAALAGDHHSSADHFDRADAVHEAMRADLWLAYGRVNRAWALVRAGDAQAARPWLDQAVAAGERMGAQRILGLAAALS